MIDPMVNLKATAAMRTEDLRIATKHREIAAARTMTPANRRAYESVLAWEQHCRAEAEAARSKVIGLSLMREVTI